MRSFIFARRNIKEYLKSPLLLFFTLIFPALMFLIFQLIKLGTGATDEMVPMFSLGNLTASISVFSYSFVALSISQIISKDRESSFQARLSVSPLTSVDFFLGYLFPALLIATIQTILSFILGICFGLTLSINLLYAFLSLILISTFYVSLGIMLGSVLSEKAGAGFSSIIIQITALFSGMFFPLQEGTFKNILSAFPFLPSIAIPQAFINFNFENILLYCLVFIGYLIIFVFLTIYLFGKKIKCK